MNRRLLLSLLAALALGVATPAAAQAPAKPATAKATFAGGCFWCVESDFDKVAGVLGTTSGYIGGTTPKPTYSQVGTGTTGHTEAVEIAFDPSKVSFRTLLDVFWRNHDPLAKDRQFCDSGNQYRAGIFYHDDEQKRLAEETRKAVQTKFAPRVVHTEVTKATAFYKAEDYHQEYYEKNPVRYRLYRFNCGRDRRLEELWGKSEKSS
jgi:peptide-methionine (S)-S-oxide reductase